MFFEAGLSPFLDRDRAIATRTIRGGTIYGIYPLNRYTRLEMAGGVVQYKEEFSDAGVRSLFAAVQQIDNYGTVVFNNGTLVPLSLTLVQEDTVFREFGPLAGSTMRLSYEVAPKIGNTLQRQVVDGDIRWYQRLGGSGLLALRLKGFQSWGDNPDFFFYGGNSEMRGYEYLEFAGHEGGFANAELRFPLIEAMLTPIGVLGGIRGVFFANIGGSHFNGQPFKFATSGDERFRPLRECRLRDRSDASVCRSTARNRPSPASVCATAAPRMASASRASCSGSRSTSTSRGARCSTRIGKTRSSPAWAAAARSASRSSRCGSATTFSRRCDSVLGMEIPTAKDLTPKRSSESATDMTQVVLPNDANPLGFMLGGTVMHLIDIAGAMAAHRHARERVVTAAVDGLQFLHSIKIGDIIILKAHVTATFNTSLEVQVDVFSEEVLTGVRKMTTHAYLTFVAVSKEGRAGAGAAAHPRDRRRAAEGRGSYRRGGRRAWKQSGSWWRFPRRRCRSRVA